MKLIFIHGRDQQGKDAKKLKQQWIDAYKKGLKKNDLPWDDTITVEFPFYGDILNDIVKGAPKGDEAITKGGSSDDVQFYYQLITELKDNAKVSDEEVLNSFDGEYIERGPLNWPWIQAILEVLDRTAFGTASIRAFTYDVFLYLTMPAVRNVVNTEVAKCFSTEECVVVGHSLGSIVGYYLLSSHQNKVVKYITVGSPLGLRSIKNKLPVPLAMPKCISKGWFNAYDERDFVALNPLDSKHFNIMPSIKNKDDVDNHTDNRHGIEGYLDDPEVSKEIYNALKKL